LHNEQAVNWIREEFPALEQRLTATYRRAVSNLHRDSERRRLRALQIAWMNNRSEECTTEYMGGHTPYELAIHQCEIDEVIRRIGWLKRIAER
jgi:uncharacterized protein YecT (DUF1311 family)